jgi:hypothetical protein
MGRDSSGSREDEKGSGRILYGVSGSRNGQISLAAVPASKKKVEKIDAGKR